MLINLKHLINFSKIKLKKKPCEGMVGLHAVTCSDFISLCYRLGKTKRLNLLRKNDLLPDLFVLLGEETN